MDQNKINKSNKSIKTVDLTIKDPLDCLSETDSLELPNLSKPKSKTSNTKDSQDFELGVKEPNP
ncbi:42419_t:CDS:2, partial [Gigaspora margarita]